MKNLFAYGTLMCGDIMAEVSGCRLSCISGTLAGYRRRSVKGEYYPAIVPDEKGFVNGVVYRDVPDSAWARLDRFEGEMYAKKIVYINIVDDEILLSMAYVIMPEYMDRLGGNWNFSDFVRNHKADFEKRLFCNIS
jgi:gamma-glutamylcyclotransferase (GGCT)/AIG2-like uncharacterized protein YtfP